MNELVFNKKFDAIVCLNAEIPDKDFFVSLNIPVFAADGAAVLLYRKGVVPDKVIGDMDSFFKEEEHKFFDKHDIIHISEQDTNDFEKTLNYCIEKEFRNILIIGFHGGQLEHSLNNWSIFHRYSKKANLCIYDKERYGISINNSFFLKTKPGNLISLIPEPYAVLKTNGLRWELNNEELKFGKREGARNEATKTKIKIEIISGHILLFLDSKLPYSPEFI